MEKYYFISMSYGYLEGFLPGQLTLAATLTTEAANTMGKGSLFFEGKNRYTAGKSVYN